MLVLAGVTEAGEAVKALMRVQGEVSIDVRRSVTVVGWDERRYVAVRGRPSDGFVFERDGDHPDRGPGTGRPARWRRHTVNGGCRAVTKSARI
jgi:hypothetical protein